MRIKKFVGPDIKNVTNQMKQDLGSEAIVLNTRRLSKGGVFGTLGSEVVEITAAIDEQEDSGSMPYAARKQPYSGRTREGTEDALVMNSATQRTPQNAHSSNAVEGIRRVADEFEKRRSEGESPLPRELKERAEFYHLQADVQDIRTCLHELTVQLKQQQTPSMPDQLRSVFARLVDNEVDLRIAGDIISTLLSTFPGVQLEKPERIEERLMQVLAGRVTTGIANRQKAKRPRIVALVGPTGVGKTTTIAKLAAREKLLNRSKVGLLTADTYRIGAIEQLRTFASIADIPMEVIYRAADILPALKKFSTCDSIYVDTVGRNQKAKRDLHDLTKIISALKPDEVHLVLSASTSASTLDDIIDKYAVVNPSHFIVSKVDEAVTFGPLFNIVQRRKHSLSYFTTGQGVPDDIVTANGIMFAALLYRGVIPNV
jgi:flagellar biosynthesis protein FlhF